MRIPNVADTELTIPDWLCSYMYAACTVLVPEQPDFDNNTEAAERCAWLLNPDTLSSIRQIGASFARFALDKNPKLVIVPVEL